MKGHNLTLLKKVLILWDFGGGGGGRGGNHKTKCVFHNPPPPVPVPPLEKRFQWGWSKSAEHLSKNPVVRSKSYNIPLLLTPVAEYDADCGSVGSGGIRRHSACDMISCLEEQKLNYAELAASSDLSGSASNRLCVGSQFKGMFVNSRMKIRQEFIQIFSRLLISSHSIPAVFYSRLLKYNSVVI